MEVRHVDVSKRRNLEYRKHGIKVPEVLKEKVKANNKMTGKLVKVNGKLVKASIRTILSENMMNVKYVKNKGFNWRCLNKKTAIGHIDDGIVRYIPSTEVDVDTTFMISEDHMSDKNILNKDCVNIMCVKDELMEKDNIIDKKKNSVDSKLNKRKSIQVKSINFNVPVKSDDAFEFDDNGDKAADSKVNDPKNRLDVTRDHRCDDNNERYVELRGAYVKQPSTMRTLNSMLKAWNYVKDPKRQYDLRYHRSNNEHLMFGSLIKSASQSAYIQDRYKNYESQNIEYYEAL
ncbi:hypothetical protein F8M41_014746 [Gigaspora margarita]|uniref:Uncharacterized protein n=1 Tax=Gigaspora margarita TaxID=4874 RepID=A0A8H4AR98_GIGMA|nr:hypothetical protein F8M41_014746 [Gigaspora margarita]